MENKESMIYVLSKNTYIDEVGGLHSGINGWNPNSYWCGECVKSSCKNCPNKDVPRDGYN